mgnify:CR=1 FL=1
MDMLKNNAVTMVMSLGMLCVMLVGGIDISIMSTLALSGMSIGMLLKYEHISSTALAFLIAIVIMAGIREKIEYNDISESFQGTPIVLLTAALMSIAFFGFSGII